jgi:hypothetical protein
MSRDLEPISSTTSLAELAINAWHTASAELAEHDQRLQKVLGERPIGPTTVGEREQEAARLECTGTLGYEITGWQSGRLQTSRDFAVPCWFASVPGDESALLVYVPSRLGLCALVECGSKNHQHLRRLSSLADLGEMLTWSPSKCLRDKLARDDDKRTLEVRIR